MDDYQTASGTLSLGLIDVQPYANQIGGFHAIRRGDHWG
jgi:hypothetical protein